jgi:hypothetical protein
MLGKIGIFLINANLMLNQPVIKYTLKNGSRNKIKFTFDLSNQFIQWNNFFVRDSLLDMAERKN